MRGRPPISSAEMASRLIKSEKPSLPYDIRVRLAVVLVMVMMWAGSASLDIVKVEDASIKTGVEHGHVLHEWPCRCSSV